MQCKFDHSDRLYRVMPRIYSEHVTFETSNMIYSDCSFRVALFNENNIMHHSSLNNKHK